MIFPGFPQRNQWKEPERFAKMFPNRGKTPVKLVVQLSPILTQRGLGVDNNLGMEGTGKGERDVLA